MDGGSEGCWQQQCLQQPFVVTSSGMGSESNTSLTATAAANFATTATARSPSWTASIGRHPQAIPLFATKKSAKTSMRTLNRRMRDSNVRLVLTTIRQRRLDTEIVSLRVDTWHTDARPGPVASLDLGSVPARTGRGHARLPQRSHEWKCASSGNGRSQYLPAPSPSTNASFTILCFLKI